MAKPEISPPHIIVLDDPGAITITVKRFTEVSGIGRSTAYEMIKSGALRSVRIMGKRLIVVERLRELPAEVKKPEIKLAARAERQPKKPAQYIGNVIYFVEAAKARLIKIGTTNYVGSRVRALQTGSPIALSFLGCIAGNINAERELHERFAKLRKHGEWFRATDELRLFIANALADRGLPVDG